ncbi:MAG: thioredoxin domain-containing protein [Acidobacteriota bacterium]
MALPLASFGQAPPTASSGAPVAVVGGQPILESDLEAALGPQQLMQLRNQEFEAKHRALENLIRLRLVEAEAKKVGIPAEKLLDREADSKVADPTDGEVEAFFLGQSRAGGRLEDVKEQYRTALKRMRLQKARQAYADSLRAKTEVVIHLRPPSVQVAYDPARVKGDPNAPVTIVEFSDFQCAYCKNTQTTLKNILTKYNGRVKLAYMDFPLREIHPLAQTAAEAARCAGEQGKFWEFHDALFADQSKLREADLAAHARALGLDEKSFQSCLASGKYKPKVEADLQEGSKAGVAGTPGFFINGVFLSGAQPQAEFEKIIDTQLGFLGKQPSSR